MRRPRGPGGRFLTADEVAQMEANGTLPTDVSKDAKGDMNGDAKNDTPSKKLKSDDDGEDDEDDG